MKRHLLTASLLRAIAAISSISLTGCQTEVGQTGEDFGRSVGRAGVKVGEGAEDVGRGVGRSTVDLHESHKAWWKRNTN